MASPDPWCLREIPGPASAGTAAHQASSWWGRSKVKPESQSCGSGSGLVRVAWVGHNPGITGQVDSGKTGPRPVHRSGTRPTASVAELETSPTAQRQ